MRNLTIDIGNSGIKYGVFEESDLIHYNRTEGISTDMIAADIAFYKPSHSIVSSTIKPNIELNESLKRLHQDIMFFDYKTEIPIHNLYKTPQTLGMDRLAAAIGAYNISKCETLIIDMGTAITYDFVTGHGEFLGGNISPGMEMRFKALHEHTSLLPLVNHEGRRPRLGEDTESAIRCGVLDGMKYEIEGYIRKFSLKHSNLCVFFTGGDELYFEDEIKKRIFADKFIVLKGLNEVLTYNIRK